MMKLASGTLFAASIGFLALGLQASAEPMIYPAKGQSQTQQDKDRYECHTWAVKQTGFDPSNPTSLLEKQIFPENEF